MCDIRVCSQCGGRMLIVPARPKLTRQHDSTESVDGLEHERIVRTRCEACGHEGLLKRLDVILANEVKN